MNGKVTIIRKSLISISANSPTVLQWIFCIHLLIYIISSTNFVHYYVSIYYHSCIRILICLFISIHPLKSTYRVEHLIWTENAFSPRGSMRLATKIIHTYKVFVLSKYCIHEIKQKIMTPFPSSYSVKCIFLILTDTSRNRSWI